MNKNKFYRRKIFIFRKLIKNKKKWRKKIINSGRVFVFTLLKLKFGVSKQILWQWSRKFIRNSTDFLRKRRSIVMKLLTSTPSVRCWRFLQRSLMPTCSKNSVFRAQKSLQDIESCFDLLLVSFFIRFVGFDNINR